jgi:hypothetical protein
LDAEEADQVELCLAKTHQRIRATTLIACVELLEAGKPFQRTAASTENRPVRSRT